MIAGAHKREAIRNFLSDGACEFAGMMFKVNKKIASVCGKIKAIKSLINTTREVSRVL